MRNGEPFRQVVNNEISCTTLQSLNSINVIWELKLHKIFMSATLSKVGKDSCTTLYKVD